MSNQSQSPSRLPLERVLFALAGTVVSVALAVFVSTWFVLRAVLVGVNQWLYVTAGTCPASIVPRRACWLRSAIYPNPSDRPEQASIGTAREEVTV